MRSLSNSQPNVCPARQAAAYVLDQGCDGFWISFSFLLVAAFQMNAPIATPIIVITRTQSIAIHQALLEDELLVSSRVGADVGAGVLTLASAIVETATVVLVAVEIADASVVVVQVPEHPPVYALVSSTPESVITNVTVAVRLLADELIAMPDLYEEHGEVHASTATPNPFS